MLEIFNADVSERLSALTAALEAAEPIAVTYHPKVGVVGQGGQPERINIAFGNRRLVFSVPMADALTEQLSLNGYGALAQQIRAAFPLWPRLQ